MESTMRNFTKLTMLIAALTAPLALGMSPAVAQEYPSKPVTLIVAFPPGGGVDNVARKVATALSEQLGQPVEVKNVAGSGGVTGTETVAAAAPDGYTLLITNPATVAINPALYNMKADPAEVLAPIARIAQTQLLGLVPIKSPAKNLREFLDIAAKAPASYNYGSGGTGNINHLGVELLKLKTGATFAHTPSNSSTAAMDELAGESVQFMMDGLHAAGELIEKKKIRPLVVFGDARLAALPDVPPAREAGVPGGLSVTSWYGLAAPKGASAAVIERIQTAVSSALATPAFAERLASEGIAPAYLDGAASAKFIAEERARWTEAVAASGARRMIDQVASVPRAIGPDRIPAVPTPTRKFDIRGDQAFLGGKPIKKIWGIRASNALMSTGVTERTVRNLDNMAEHGLNGVLVYLSGSNTGWPYERGARSAYGPDGALKPEFMTRLEWLIREADQRGMVVGVGLLSPRNQPRDAAGNVTEESIKAGIQNVARFLVDRQLRNVFIDLMHEFAHRRVDADLLREPDGPAKKAKLASWFHEVAPDYKVGVCGTILRTETAFPGADFWLIQKTVQIPPSGYVINCEMHKRDNYDTEGIFDDRAYERMFAWLEQYKMAPNAGGYFLHSGWTQGVSGFDGAAPYAEMGGYGRSPEDRGIRFYYEWVRDNYGRWVYPDHVPVKDKKMKEARR
jgi:tripartite-type tricarboxylate transporter receptor subunit TctC